MPEDRMGNDAPSTLAELATWASSHYGSRTFLECWSSKHGTVGRFTFEEFAKIEHDFRGLLQLHGVVPGSRVALLSHACADSLALSLACCALGGILVNLNWRQPESTLQVLLKGLECHLLVAGPSLSACARRLRGSAARITHRLLFLDGAERELSTALVDGEYPVSCSSTNVGGSDAPSQIWNRATFTTTATGSSASRSPAPTDVAVLMFTSGVRNLRVCPFSSAHDTSLDQLLQLGTGRATP